MLGVAKPTYFIFTPCLIEENGQFFYEGVNDLTPTPANAGTSPSKGADEILNQVQNDNVDCRVAPAPRNDSAFTWNTEVFDKTTTKHRQRAFEGLLIYGFSLSL